MCEVAQVHGVLTLQPWRQHVRVEENSASKRSQEVNASWERQSLEKDSERVCPGQVQPNHHHRREGKQLSDAARESLITFLKVVTDADDNMFRILVTIG